jgi:hypothetical protein
MTTKGRSETPILEKRFNPSQILFILLKSETVYFSSYNDPNEFIVIFHASPALMFFKCTYKSNYK